MLIFALAALAVTVVAILVLARARWRQERAAARWTVSARIGVRLAEGLESIDTVGDVLRLLVPEHADWCMLHLVEDQRVRRGAFVHMDRAMEERLQAAFERMPFVSDAPAGPARVIQTGRPYLIRDFTPGILEKQPDPDLLQAAGIGSCISVPLKARHDTLGVLTLARRAPRAYDQEDLVWTEDLAHRMGVALENRRLYAQARELFEQAVTANFVSTPDGRLVACNRAFITLLGFRSVEEALSIQTVSLYFDPADRERYVADLRAQRRLFDYEIMLRRRDGQQVVARANAIGTFDDRGELVKITGSLVDRTAQKDLEEQLRQAQRLEAIGQLAGGIAHDFNNLLTVIIGSADLIRAAGPPPRIEDHDPLDELAKAAGRAASLTQQLLAFSRRQVLQPRILDLNEALRNVHAMLRHLTRSNVVLMLDLNPTIDRVQVDPGQLDQVLVNLVVNSTDAMPKGGIVTVSTANAELTDADVAQYPYVKRGSYVALTVQDTGDGMDEATRARAFEPFFTTKPVGKGTGLGLSTVYGIVKQSGGFVWVTSAEGVGTTVKICLPAVSSEASRSDPHRGAT